MTEEKRKRGRPPGSGKKKEVVGPFNPDILSAEVKAVFDAPKIDTMVDEHPQYETVDPKLKPPIPTKTLNLDGESGKKSFFPDQSQQPIYPANWATLSKIDKLSWLTEQKSKK